MLEEDGSFMINFHRIGQIFVNKFIPKTHEECNQILRAQNNPAQIPFENYPPLNDLEKELQERNKEIDKLNLEIRKLRIDIDRQQDEFNRRLEELVHSQSILSQPLQSTSNGLNMHLYHNRTIIYRYYNVTKHVHSTNLASNCIYQPSRIRNHNNKNHSKF